MRSRVPVVCGSTRTVARRGLGYDSDGRWTMRDRHDLPLSDSTADDLPPPGDGFAWRASRAGLTLVCRALEPCAAHLFTTREWRLGTAGGRDRDARGQADAGGVGGGGGRLC